ncbi:MAG TPA: sigma-70 family RNA polymerase sigma factor [Polyangia bacterium]|nr:sigma-70 family RNA polymerase sigma factor [Polyangia bacterium]
MDAAALRSDDSIIRRCVAGENAAWRDLHRALYPLAYSFLRKMGVDDAEVDDVCQEVFVQVFRYLGRFQQRAQLTTWLYKICLSQTARMRRRHKVTQALVRLFGEREASAVQASLDLPEDELARRTGIALAELSDAHREVFVLYELQGLTGEQIAEIVGCPLPTVWSRLHYARLEFRRAVEETGGVAASAELEIRRADVAR